MDLEYINEIYLFCDTVCNIFNVTKLHSNIKTVNVKFNDQEQIFSFIQELSFSKYIGSGGDFARS